MPHRETRSLGRPCPNCGAAISRKTVNPNKPLGMVVCSKCPYKSPIDVYVERIQAEVKAKAKQRKAQG